MFLNRHLSPDKIGKDFRGVLEVRDNVVFMANTAGANGGAVSLPLYICSHRSGFCSFSQRPF